MMTVADTGFVVALAALLRHSAALISSVKPFGFDTDPLATNRDPLVAGCDRFVH